MIQILLMEGRKYIFRRITGNLSSALLEKKQLRMLLIWNVLPNDDLLFFLSENSTFVRYREIPFAYVIYQKIISILFIFPYDMT